MGGQTSLIYTNEWYIIENEVDGRLHECGREARALPSKLQAKLMALVSQIQGLVRGGWPNCSKLGGSRHHCHLSYRYVACWRVADSETRTVEIYYAGERQDAPY